jgi:uncharacterized protein (TIGR02145 family)
LVWTINGVCGSSYDTVFLLFPTPLVVCSASLVYSGETYPIVKIGNKCWFAKNLNVGSMVQVSVTQTNNGTIEKYCYDNSTANCNTYGGLYQWAEAVQYQNGASNTASPNPAFSGNVRGICPLGWHIPTDAELGSIATALGGANNAGGALKSTSTLWLSPNTGANNSSGFSGLPAGWRNAFSTGSFMDINYFTGYWSSTDNPYVMFRDLYYNRTTFSTNTVTKASGFSIRCAQD